MTIWCCWHTGELSGYMLNNISKPIHPLPAGTGQATSTSQEIFHSLLDKLQFLNMLFKDYGLLPDQSCSISPVSLLHRTCCSSTCQDSLELFVMFLKPFTNNVFTAAGRIILLKEVSAIGECSCLEGLYLVHNDV